MFYKHHFSSNSFIYSFLSSDAEDSQNSSSFRNVANNAAAPPPVKRPRGRPRRQPLSEAPSASQSEMCENTPPNSADKRKIQSENDSQSETETESKKQKIEEGNSEEMRSKYQQYWNKHCSTRLQTKIVDASKNSPCSQNNENSNKSDEQGSR